MARTRSTGKIGNCGRFKGWEAPLAYNDPTWAGSVCC